MCETSDKGESNGAYHSGRGILEFHPSTAETLRQITPQICNVINDFKEALKLPVRSGELEHVEQGPEPPELTEVLQGEPEGTQVAIRAALSYAAHAAAEEQREHLVHFSWAPSAGVVHRAAQLVAPHLAGLFRLAALSHVRRHVYALVSRDNGGGHVQGLVLLDNTSEHDKSMGMELTNILAVAEKACSSVLQGQGRGRDVAALQAATQKLRNALDSTPRGAVGQEPATPGGPPALLKKLPFQLRTARELHQRGHSTAAGLLASLKTMVAEADLPLKVAASGYVTTVLAKIATHLERLDNAVEEAEIVMAEAAKQYPGLGIEDRPTPPPSEAMSSCSSPRHSVDTPIPATKNKKRRARKGKEEKTTPAGSPLVKQGYRETMEALQLANGPSTPRKPDDDRMADGTPRPFGCRRLTAVSSDEEAARQVPGQLPDQPGGTGGLPAQSSAEPTGRAGSPGAPGVTDLGSPKGLSPLITRRSRAAAPLTDSLESESQASQAVTPLSFSSDEIHPDFHLLDDLRCPLKKVLMVNPVVAADGWTYEKASIVEWMEKHTESPMTHRTMPNSNLTPNLMARSMLQKLAMAQRRRTSL